MGRPKKYHTPEEKKAADCLKSAKYHKKYVPVIEMLKVAQYCSSNRKKVNRKRRKARALAKASREDEEAQEVKEGKSNAEETEPEAPEPSR